MCGSHWHFLQAMYGGCHRLPSAAQQGGRTCNNSSVPNCSQDEAAPTPWLYRSVGDSPIHPDKAREQDHAERALRAPVTFDSSSRGARRTSLAPLNFTVTGRWPRHPSLGKSGGGVLAFPGQA